MKKTFRDLILIMLGSFTLSVGLNYFTIPNMLSEGGVIGITIILHYLFHWSSGIINFILNTVLFLIGYKFFDRRTTIYTLFSIVATSVFLYVTEQTAQILTDDTLLAALFSGVLVGLGIGLIFRAGGTSGGASVLAKIANQFFGISIGKGILAMDIIVVFSSILVIGIEKAMYTFFAVWVGSKAIDFIVEGLDERIAVLIISNQSDKILDEITESMSRGLTILDGKGGYTGAEKEILYIVINNQELVRLERIINEIDNNAYVTVHNVHEIMRKGYQPVK